MEGSRVFGFAKVETGVPVETARGSIGMHFGCTSPEFNREVCANIRVQPQNSS